MGVACERDRQVLKPGRSVYQDGRCERENREQTWAWTQTKQEHFQNKCQDRHGKQERRQNQDEDCQRKWHLLDEPLLLLLFSFRSQQRSFEPLNLAPGRVSEPGITQRACSVLGCPTSFFASVSWTSPCTLSVPDIAHQACRQIPPA